MADSQLRRALVTGGAGFIGHHLVRALLARGLEVNVLDDLSMGRRENVPERARLLVGDVRDPALLREALRDVHVVFHEAAIVSIRASVERFVRDAEVNLLGTLQLLQALAGTRVRKAVLASSMAVYADSPQPVPLREDFTCAPVSPYGVAKLACEHYWHLLCLQLGIAGTVLRYFNTYGPNQTPTPYVGVITIFIQKLLAGEAPMIYGDGEQRRDFIHVDDIVAANLAVLDGDAASRTFNVGTGRATSVNEIARELGRILAPGVAPRHAPAVPGELRNSIADVSALEAALGWKPSRVGVQYADVVEWWRCQSR